jgi:hypothetical protein
MKTSRLLRVLSLLGFLLLLAPFYDSCDGNYIHKVNNEGTEIKLEKSLKKKVYDVIVNDEAFNAFQIASLSIYVVKDFTFAEFKEVVSKFFQKDNWYKNIGTIISFFFDFIILISFSMFILSFTERIKALNKLALINSILILITFGYIIFFDKSFEYFRQIKWGYYTFIIINILIFYYSKRELNKRES